MKRKIGGIVLALALAVVGTIALVSYVNRAKDEATQAETQVEVLVLTGSVRLGAPLSEIDDSVELTKVPQRLLAPDALASLADLDPVLVAGIELREGEQLLRSRLVNPESLIRVDVPEGLQELTVRLDPEQAVGGVLKPGERVGLIFSFDTFDPTATGETTTTTTIPGETPAPAITSSVVKMTLNRVLLTAVQVSEGDAERSTQSGSTNEDGTTTNASVETAPGDDLLLTLAVSTSQAEQVVYAATFGQIWMTRQTDATNVDGSRVTTIGQVFITVPG